MTTDTVSPVEIVFRKPIPQASILFTRRTAVSALPLNSFADDFMNVNAYNMAVESFWSIIVASSVSWINILIGISLFI